MYSRLNFGNRAAGRETEKRIPAITLHYVTAYTDLVGIVQQLYRVRLSQPELWEGYEGTRDDKLEIEIFENWLEALDTHA